VAGLIDDSYWRSINVKVKDGNTCSYRMLNSDASVNKNVFEVQLSSLDNVSIGLYYGQLS